MTGGVVGDQRLRRRFPQGEYLIACLSPRRRRRAGVHRADYVNGTSPASMRATAPSRDCVQFAQRFSYGFGIACPNRYVGLSDCAKPKRGGYVGASGWRSEVRRVDSSPGTSQCQHVNRAAVRVIKGQRTAPVNMPPAATICVVQLPWQSQT